MRRLGTVALVGGALVTTGLAGCRFDEHKQDGKENVRLATPFGGMSVKTDENEVQNRIGVDVYPGAVLEKKEKENDSSADVNFSFGGFHLGVTAVSYTTPDSPEKVLAFYKSKLTKFGTVIQCSHDEPVGTPSRTPEGLTCDENQHEHGVHVNVHHDKDKTELRAGSPQHQHIVGIEDRPGGTKFGLVLLDLPGKVVNGDDDDKQ